MLLYIHVPFCRQRCSYCAFQAMALGRDVDPASSALVQDYFDNLFMELSLWGDRLGPRTVETVFLGGGTPSLMPSRMIGILLEKIAKVFHLAHDAEITLEANPESCKGTLLPSELLKAGVNRLSLGLQSLDPDQLRLLGRVHKVEDSVTAIWAAREAGFINLGVELIWGLPGQSVRHWLRTLKEVIKLAPEHISAYGLTLESGTKLEEEVRKGQLVLPPERDQQLMFMEGTSFLQRHGYLHYEISNFAKMGYNCRHNLGYWQGADYLGLGPSATSTIASLRWTNPARPSLWGERVRKGQLGGEEEVLSPMVKVLEMIMLSLRTSQGLSLKRYKELTQHDFLQDHQRMVQAMYENGLIRIRKGSMRLTINGMVVSNAILSNLFKQTKKILAKEDLGAIAEKSNQSLNA